MKRKKELTKEYLIKLGITDVTPDGRIFKNGKELKQHIHNSKGKKKYFCVSLYDPEIRKATKAEKNYISGSFPLCVHVINYVWYHNELPAGLEIHHLDGNKTNNSIDNLVALTREEHLQAHQKIINRQIKCKLNKPLSFYQNKLEMHLENYEQAKKVKDKRQIINSADNISKTKARIRYWKAHNKQGETKND